MSAHGVGDGREQRGEKQKHLHSCLLLPSLGREQGLAVGCTKPPSSIDQPEIWPPLPYLPYISLICSLLLFYILLFCFLRFLEGFFCGWVMSLDGGRENSHKVINHYC